jgi:hypothetical protein
MRYVLIGLTLALAACSHPTAPRNCIAVSQPNNPMYHADTTVITCRR